ncbi:MAG: T9SS type A sorting domain-containing protein, partial [Hymenobacter sp.]
GSSYLTHQGNNPAGLQAYGAWLGTQDRYLGVRLRSSAAAGWRYGWVRLQVTSSTNPVTLVLKDYALGTTLLAQQPAQAAGWQIYPTQVTDQLTLEPPTPTGQSQVTVADLCGRAVARAVVSGRRQQVSLAGLAAGVYLVQLDTPTGHFVQRIVKQ